MSLIPGAVGVASSFPDGLTATSITPSTGIVGLSGSATPAAGYIGEMMELSNNSNCTTGAYTDITGVMTLTAGVWLIGGSSLSDNNAGVTGHQTKLYIKGTAVTTSAKGELSITGLTAASQSSLTFTPRVAVIASGDTKTCWIEARASGATSTIYGYIVAVRIA